MEQPGAELVKDHRGVNAIPQQVDNALAFGEPLQFVPAHECDLTRGRDHAPVHDRHRSEGFLEQRFRGFRPLA